MTGPAAPTDEPRGADARAGSEPSALGPTRPPARVRPKRPGRWVEVSTTLVLSAAVVVVAFTAAPPLFRAAGAGRAAPQASVITRSVVDRGHTSVPQRFGGNESEDDAIDDVAPARGRVGFARRSLELLDRAADGATATGHVEEGEIVLVVQEAGEWVFVVRDASATGSGWTRKSGIAVR